MTPYLAGRPYAYDISIDIDEAYATTVDADNLHQMAVATLQHCTMPKASLTIVITGDDEVRDLNRTYREIDAPTDVLSFANLESSLDLLSQGPVQDKNANRPPFVLPPELTDDLMHYLGDIVIAFPYATRQAARFETLIDAELRLLVVHGLLHLLGYDHDSPANETEMWRTQDAILAHVGEQARSPRAYDE